MPAYRLISYALQTQRQAGGSDPALPRETFRMHPALPIGFEYLSQSICRM